MHTQGPLNNYRMVLPTLQFSIDAPEAQRAFVVGDWDGWLVRRVLLGGTIDNK